LHACAGDARLFQPRLLLIRQQRQSLFLRFRDKGRELFGLLLGRKLFNFNGQLERGLFAFLDQVLQLCANIDGQDDLVRHFFLDGQRQYTHKGGFLAPHNGRHAAHCQAADNQNHSRNKSSTHAFNPGRGVAGRS
jgi:hypothetical protein